MVVVVRSGPGGEVHLQRPGRRRRREAGLGGNSAIGSGSQEIIESRLRDRIVNALDFGGSQATAGYRLVAEGGGTRVTWSMDSAHGYNPAHRWFGAFLLDDVVGKDYEKGLAKLKAVLEDGPRS